MEGEKSEEKKDEKAVIIDENAKSNNEEILEVENETVETIKEENGEKEKENFADDMKAEIFSIGGFMITQAYLLKGKDGKYVLIDSLMPGKECKEIVEKAIDGKEIKYHIVNHGHFDHYGQTKFVLEKNSGCKVIAHEYAIEKMKFGGNSDMVPSRFGAKLQLLLMKIFLKSKDDSIAIKDGCIPISDKIELPEDIKKDLEDNWGIEIFLLPGHTRCSLSVYRKDTDEMFVGDLVEECKKKVVNYFYLIYNKEALHEGFKKIVSMDPKTIYSTHVKNTFTPEDIKKRFTDVFPKE